MENPIRQLLDVTKAFKITSSNPVIIMEQIFSIINEVEVTFEFYNIDVLIKLVSVDFEEKTAIIDIYSL
jgi:hypothetical protein